MKYSGFVIGDDLHPMFENNIQITTLKETVSRLIEESNKELRCTKNRYGHRTMDDCRNIEFEKVKLSELNIGRLDIYRKYHEKNVWLILDE